MSDISIPVDVTAAVSAFAGDPLSLYQNAVTGLGEAQVFLLESLAGPERDRKTSMVGMNCLFTVSIYEQYAELDAPDTLREVLVAHLAEAGYTPGPDSRITLRDSDQVWNLLRTLRSAFKLGPDVASTMQFFGYLSYDSVRFMERLPCVTADTSGYPFICLSVFQTLVNFDLNGDIKVRVLNAPAWPARTPADYLPLFARVPDSAEVAEIAYPEDIEVVDSVAREDFLKWVEKALYHISIGDIYQIQLGHEVTVRSPVKPFDVYRAMRHGNSSPYMYLTRLGNIDLIGASPELFLSIDAGVIEMRPIAGTVGKRAGVDPEELIQSMMNSGKERAEHVMLVDLCRNDIGRVCRPGSLGVDELMVVEEYSHLYHMVSNVRGDLREDFDAFDVIKASFPAGTMTGAPKIRAMELIEGFEVNRRGIYAGAVGLVGFDDSVNTALCIRSAVHRDGVYSLRASAGVVADSVPEKEWLETLFKMSSVYRAVTGKEMMQ